jgi:CheY-like chemotaxis protein
MATVLLVGPDDVDRQAARSTLEHAGHVVVEATSSRFLRLVGERPVDAAVIDIRPPQEIVLLVGLMELRRRRPALPIVALCGGPKARDLLKLAVQAGADGALRRPFTHDQLVRAVALGLAGPQKP